MGIGKTNKRKGSNEEREIVNKYKEIGWDKAATCRFTSQLLDNCKIDINYVPLNTQVKKGYVRSRPKFDELSIECEELMKKYLPKDHPNHNYPYVLFHSLGGGRKRKPNNHMMTVNQEFGLFLLSLYKEYLDGKST